jgi:hypothetical protein
VQIADALDPAVQGLTGLKPFRPSSTESLSFGLVAS